MSMVSGERLGEAVNLLIASESYARLVNEMTGILENWACHPMTYGGHLAPLNALIDVGVSDRAAFERLVRLAETKRKLIPAAKRVDYQREFMAGKRARLARAVELQELTRGPFGTAADRRAYEKEVNDRWMAARDKFVSAKGKLSWADRNAARGEFWEGIDATLETNLQVERARKGKT